MSVDLNKRIDLTFPVCDERFHQTLGTGASGSANANSLAAANAKSPTMLAHARSKTLLIRT